MKRTILYCAVGEDRTIFAVTVSSAMQLKKIGAVDSPLYRRLGGRQAGLKESNKPLSRNIAFLYADYTIPANRFCLYENSIV
jgi:hypothetical protein